MVVRRKLERKEEKEKVRRALLSATLRLAATYGFSSLSLREVAREAEIAPTSFYRHFEDMEQLGLALIEERVGPSLLGLVEPCRVAKRAWDVPGLLVKGLFSWLDEDPELVRFMLAERVGSLEATRVAVGTRVDVFIDELRDAMRSAGSDEAIPLVVAEAIAVLAFEALLKALDASPEQRRSAHEDVHTQLAILEAGTHAQRQS